MVATLVLFANLRCISTVGARSSSICVPVMAPSKNDCPVVLVGVFAAVDESGCGCIAAVRAWFGGGHRLPPSGFGDRVRTPGRIALSLGDGLVVAEVFIAKS